MSEAAVRERGSLYTVIVNADDFGRDEATNRGIVEAFERGLTSSTTVMANQPGFAEAAALAHEHGLAEHVGIHLVLSSGTPLTQGIRRLPRFCDSDGFFRGGRSGALRRLSDHERECVALEFRAQVERVRSARLRITHVDSHHHVHTDWGVGTCVLDLCGDMGIPYVRLARNCGPGIGVARRAAKWAVNARLRRRGLARTRWFGDPIDWLHLQRTGAPDSTLDDFELMTHPRVDESGELVDSVAGANLPALLAPIPFVHTASSYSGARSAQA